jgi:hypothetical protein
MNNTKNLFVTPNEKLLCIKGTEHLFSVCHKTNDFVTETVAENIEEKTAHLFAAAPDLLDALDWALRQIEDDLDPDHQAAFDAALSTLRKAKGE